MSNNNSIYNLFKTTVSNIFKPYISNKIPNSQTNVFYMLFSGIDHSFTHLENLLRSHKRERNILTAQHISSLRTLASSNGYEPVLKIPSKGLVTLTIEQKLFNRVGFPIYVPPYASFKNDLTGVRYYYDSNKVLNINTSSVILPLVEGEISQLSFTSTGDELERIYLQSDAIGEGSISIYVNNIQYTEVKSFIDNSGIDKCFVVKFSERPSAPIVIYVKGTKQNDNINVTYRSTYGESGNINYQTTFSSESLLGSNGEPISLTDNDVTVVNVSGFDLGSNGTDKNTLKAAIGFNHGINLLFDTVSYTNFITKYSTLLLQGIKLENPLHKSINTIYVGRKQSLTTNDNVVINQYKSIIESRSYLLSATEKESLTTLLEDNEFALSSHILKDLNVTKYAIQIVFNSQSDVDLYSNKLDNEIYKAFSIFLKDKSYVLNLELLFNNFMNDNNVLFTYDLFNSDIEQLKIVNNTTSTTNKSVLNDSTVSFDELKTSFIIKHEDTLPILNGDFAIKSNDSVVDLFFDINTVIKI